MTREDAFKIIKENLCGMCVYGCHFMELCDISSCDNRDAIEVLEQELSEDCISRQAAIDILDDYQVMIENGERNSYAWARQQMSELPSAQPEIVRCKDCKWYELPSHKITENCVRWMKSNGVLLPIKPNDYCSYAEVKNVENN